MNGKTITVIVIIVLIIIGFQFCSKDCSSSKSAKSPTTSHPEKMGPIIHSFICDDTAYINNLLRLDRYKKLVINGKVIKFETNGKNEEKTTDITLIKRSDKLLIQFEYAHNDCLLVLNNKEIQDVFVKDDHHDILWNGGGYTDVELENNTLEIVSLHSELPCLYIPNADMVLTFLKR